jgi:hypothetical protein
LVPQTVPNDFQPTSCPKLHTHDVLAKINWPKAKIPIRRQINGLDFGSYLDKKLVSRKKPNSLAIIGPDWRRHVLPVEKLSAIFLDLQHLITLTGVYVLLEESEQAMKQKTPS